MKGRTAMAVGVVGAAAFVYHALYWWTGWIDDAYITLRHGRNLWEGDGLVFNAGQPVEGLTNLLWGVLLAPFSNVDALLAAKVLGLAFALGTLGLLVAWCRDEALHPVVGGVALLPWVVLPWAPFWAVQGLETPAVAFCVTLAWTRYRTELRRGGLPLAALGLGFAPALRPDAALLAPAVGLYHLVRRGGLGRHVLVSAALVTACALALVGAKLHWYGGLLPQPFHAKAGHWPFAHGRAYVTSFLLVPWPGFAAGLAVALLWGAWARRLPAVVLALYLVIAWVSDGDWFANFRLVVPALPALGACMALAAQRLLVEFPERAFGLFSVAVLGMAAVGPAAVVDEVDGLREEPTESRKAGLLPQWRGSFDEQWVFPAAWVLVHANPLETVAFTDIGLFSWVNPNPVVDLLGLTDPVMTLDEDGSLIEQARWQREHLAGDVHLLVIDTDGGRYTQLAAFFQRDGWQAVDGCGSLRVMAGPRVHRPVGGAYDNGLDGRLERLFRTAPRHLWLQVAVLRELAAAGATRDRLQATLDRLGEGLDMPNPGLIHSLECDLGLAEGCSVAANLCGGGRARTRATAMPEVPAPQTPFEAAAWGLRKPGERRR